MLRTVIVEQKSSQSGRRKTITRTFEHELNSSDQAAVAVVSYLMTTTARKM